jgi:hypothetical protein
LCTKNLRTLLLEEFLNLALHGIIIKMSDIDSDYEYKTLSVNSVPFLNPSYEVPFDTSTVEKYVTEKLGNIQPIYFLGCDQFINYRLVTFMYDLNYDVFKIYQNNKIEYIVNNSNKSYIGNLASIVNELFIYK